jgi:uncharacterized membrane protein YbhN (UPF0104 family)
MTFPSGLRDEKHMKDIKRWLPGAIVSILLIAAILYFVDLRAMLDAIRHANYTLLGIGILLGFVWIAIRTIVWRTLLRNRASYADVFFTIGEGYLLNNFLPFRLGEIGPLFCSAANQTLRQAQGSVCNSWKYYRPLSSSALRI